MRNYLNFLYRKIMSGEKFQLWKNVRRNLIDVSDVQAQISIMLGDNLALNNIVNICSDRDHTAAELVGVLEKVTGRVAAYATVENLEDHDHPVVREKNEHFTSVLETKDDYLELVLRKYYA
jgi:nucleoside-diphosphate-sugar epimerase